MVNALPGAPGLLPLSRHEALFAGLLTSVLLVATAPFFGTFSLAALGVGALLAASLHRQYARSRSTTAERPGGATGMPGFNVSAIQVAGDAGGLIFVVGSIAIFVLSLPGLRWFLVGSLVFACALAAVRRHWTSRHSVELSTRLITR
jgi:hypothetical protein